MTITCSKGSKGRFKTSKLEFEIIETAGDSSTIRIRFSGVKAEVKDNDLRAAADAIDEFSDKK